MLISIGLIFVLLLIFTIVLDIVKGETQIKYLDKLEWICIFGFTIFLYFWLLLIFTIVIFIYNNLIKGN